MHSERAGAVAREIRTRRCRCRRGCFDFHPHRKAADAKTISVAKHGGSTGAQRLGRIIDEKTVGAGVRNDIAVCLPLDRAVMLGYVVRRVRQDEIIVRRPADTDRCTVELPREFVLLVAFRLGDDAQKERHRERTNAKVSEGRSRKRINPRL